MPFFIALYPHTLACQSESNVRFLCHFLFKSFIVACLSLYWFLFYLPHITIKILGSGSSTFMKEVTVFSIASFFGSILTICCIFF